MTKSQTEETQSSTYQGEEVELDTELQVFDFSNYPLPNKTDNILRIFYNNINGLEINTAIQTVVNNKKTKQKEEFIRDLEQYTKIEAFVKQMHSWEVDINVLAEPCIEWRDTIPRQVVKDISKKYDRMGNWTDLDGALYSTIKDRYRTHVLNLPK